MFQQQFSELAILNSGCFTECLCLVCTQSEMVRLFLLFVLLHSMDYLTSASDEPQRQVRDLSLLHFGFEEILQNLVPEDQR